MTNPTHKLRIMSDPDTINDLSGELAAQDGVAEVRKGELVEPSELDFDIATVAAVVVIVQALFLDESLASTLMRVFHRKQTIALVIEGEFGSASIELNRNFTEKELTKILRAVSEPKD